MTTCSTGVKRGLRKAPSILTSTPQVEGGELLMEDEF